jgi:hypothetical protein
LVVRNNKEDTVQVNAVPHLVNYIN